MLFEGPPAMLPIATLRQTAARDRRRVLLGELERWLAVRRAWLGPRVVPLLVALAGLFATLGAMKYVGPSPSDRLTIRVHPRWLDHAPAELAGAPPELATPTHLVVLPISTHGRYLVLAVEPPR